MNTNEQLEKALQWAFQTPGRIQQQEWELRTFIDKVRNELKPERTVELGSWRGTTAAILSLVTSSVTISLDKDEYGGKEDALRIAAGQSLSFRIANAMFPETALSIGGPIDLLFVDDGHKIEEVTAEHKLWAPFVRKGGWIVFHDINPDANQCAPGVHPSICQAHVYWQQLTGDKEEIIFHGQPPGPGLGILRV